MKSSKIVNRFLELAAADQGGLTPMQLLKLVFLAHGWTLGLYRRALIGDLIEAWKYGPVIPALYHDVKHFRSAVITSLLKTAPREKLDEVECDIVRQVYQIYGHLTGPQLSTGTHEPDLPWDEVYDEDSWAAVIDNKRIGKYYARKAGKG